MAINTLSNFGVWTGDSGAVERTRKHPVQQFRFEGVFDNFAGSIGGKELTLELFTITVPDVSFDVVTIPGGNSEVKITGKRHVGDWSFTVNDTLDGAVLNVIKKQESSQSSALTTAVATVGSNYKFTTTVRVLDGHATALMTHVMEGCLIRSTTVGGFDYNNSAEKRITVNCSCDNYVAYDATGNPMDAEVASTGLQNLFATGLRTLMS